MKSRGSFLFSIVLLLVNATGAAGALLTALGMTFGTVLLPVPFLFGMLLCCLLSVFLWSTRNKVRAAIQWFLLAGGYAACLLLFWKNRMDGMGWALQGLFGKMNERYGIHLIWDLPQETEDILVQATCSVLAVMLLYVLLLGYAVVRGRVLALLMADAAWFAAACVMDDFPAYVWLVICILGLAAVIIRNAFRDDERAGIQAVLIGAAVLGAVMAPVYRFAVPFLDSRYDAVLEARIELNIKINEEWIPRIKSMLAKLGTGSDTDVTGKLTRKTGTAYTSAEIYRVTFSSAPRSTVYLRGFVGRSYAGNEWMADKDSALEKYYRRKGWTLPESGSDLVNLTYNAFCYRTPEQVSVEELAAPGSYTVYPYGAQIPEDYKVHWDGTVEWKSGSYEFFYSAPEDYSSERRLTGTASRDESEYRAYVYDTFCEYPAKEFPRLTEFLESSGFRTDSVYDSLADVLAYLRRTAVYDLDAPNTPRGEDFVEYFLFESGEGYCTHFASSAVLMLRYLGVPARYVTGYAVAPGDFKRNDDGTYSAVILDKQAHAWTEVYLDRIGWVPVEMTPGAAPFPRDNTAEQLALAERLAGDSGSGSQQLNPSIEWDDFTGQEESGGSESTAGQEDFAGQEESAEEDGVGQEESAGDKGAGQESSVVQGDSAGESSGGQKESGGDGGAGQESSVGVGNSGQGVPDQGGSGWFGNFGQKTQGQGVTSQNPGVGENAQNIFTRVSELFAGAMAVLKRVFTVVGPVIFIVGIWRITRKLVRRNCRRRLEQAENREKVFLLYRNTQRLLQVSGCAGRLSGPGEDMAEFNRLLEKCGFGEKEPTTEELQKVRDFCEGLEKEAYAGLPFYKKPLFSELNIYGLTGQRKAS